MHQKNSYRGFVFSLPLVMIVNGLIIVLLARMQ
jgi:hypothetical protein